jgi:glycosyltransferase involved in cell wall biosynthesis
LKRFIDGDSRLRTLLVCEPGLDGVFRHTEALARFLLRNGMRVDLAFSSIRGSDCLNHLTRSIEQAGGSVLDLRVGNAPQLGDAPAFAKLLLLVRQTSPDVIHCHSSKAGILGRVAGSLSGVPTLYTPNAYFGMGKKGGVRTALFNGLERLFAGFGHTINVSEDEAAFAGEQLGLKPSQQTLIPNAVDTEVFKPASTEEKRQWRRAKGLPADSIVFGSLGRLSYQKDPLTLYRSFEIFARKHPTVYLAHLGTGELKEDCEEWIQRSGLGKHIVRMDYSPEPSDFYRGLDGFVLSSRYEGLSFAVLEALATDLPLVLTDVPGNRDFIRLGLSHVWSAPMEDPGALATAMEVCLLDMEQRRPSNHRAVALERFSEEACFGKVLELYREIANSRRKQHSLASSA